ncbi:MAG: SIMPL domain-containing protein [Rhodobacteraceae bacterium]|nr:SIMPL domain-containing protein [Paracoccaceae bacterium]
MRLVPLVAAAMMLALPAFAADPVPTTISVSGEGRVEVVPDLATVSLGVTTDADTASAAMTANSGAVAQVLDRLKAAGIEPRDVQTSGLSLGPRYDYGRGDGTPPKLLGYTVSDMVTVRVRDLAKLGGVLDGVVADGANTLNGLGFGLAEDAEARDEARRRAVADARHRAELYAGAAGVKLGRLISISEAGMSYPPMPMAEASFAKAADVPIATGEVSIGASVSLVYEIAE